MNPGLGSRPNTTTNVSDAGTSASEEILVVRHVAYAFDEVYVDVTEAWQAVDDDHPYTNGGWLLFDMAAWRSRLMSHWAYTACVAKLLRTELVRDAKACRHRLRKLYREAAA